MKNEPLVLEITYDAPVARVWKALTHKDQMKGWYFDLSEFKAETGFEFQFSGKGKEGENYVHLCTVTEVIPYKKLAYSWRYEGYEGSSFVRFELFDADGKTKIRLTHEGLDSFPALPAFAKENFNQGWTRIIGSSLKVYVEKTAV